MKHPVLGTLHAVAAMHAELIAEHGACWARADRSAGSGSWAPQHQHSYSKPRPRLGASLRLWYSLARNHCFADGNKRIALAVIGRVPAIDGRELTAEEVDAAELFTPCGRKN